MKRILLTGASGFLGRYCLPALTASGDEIHCVTSRSILLADPDVYWHAGDLLERDDIVRLIRRIRPTHLLHLAWNATPGEFWESAENLRWLDCSLTLLREFVRCGGERVVIAGTCAEYDWSHGVCCESRTPIRPTTVYGKCKAALQLAVSAMGPACGIDTAWTRLFFLYGPGAPAQKFPAAVYYPLAENRPAHCSLGQQKRDFLYVRDAADALVKIVQSSVRGEFNIGSGVAVKIADMATRVATLMGRQHLLRLGATRSRAEEPPLIVADIGRLRRELDWAPSYSLDQGLSETLAWLRQTEQRQAA